VGGVPNAVKNFTNPSQGYNKTMKKFYTYAFLREDRTPYYIGKGSGNRAFKRNLHERKCPPPERILILKSNLTEEEAFRHERYMIFLFGREDLGTGILHNFSDGGEGASGVRRSKETRQKMADAKRGANNPMKRPEVAEKMAAQRRGKPNPEQAERMRGKTQSDETKQKRSKALKLFYSENPSASKGAKRPQISAKLKGRKLSEETRRKMSEAQLRRQLKRRQNEEP
jgi:hypothetical protein